MIEAPAPGPTGSVFGALFAERRSPPLSEALLLALSETMNDGDSPFDESSRSPESALFAGYTYLGQFIDHDLSLDRTGFRLSRMPSGPLRNSRRPRFDLESLYGAGPEEDGDLYQPDRLHLAIDGADLARRSTGTARIRDARNDSNRIVSQVHVAFAAFHNRVVDDLAGAACDDASLFEAARRVVRRHYQWIVVHDFLPTIVGQALVDELLSENASNSLRGLKLFRPGLRAFMPIEFAAAAFRFGHSMVRSSYRLNSTSGTQFLFERNKPFDAAAIDLRGFRPLAPEMRIEWNLFFELPDAETPTLQLARPIDPLIARPLFELPHGVAHATTQEARTLAYRNLVRGEFVHHLPTGQEIALEMQGLGIDIADVEILGLGRPFEIEPGMLIRGSLDDLGGTGIDVAGLERAIGHRTPLWYYILKEAEQFQRGERLGKVGGRIVAETIIALLLWDGDSILGSHDSWRPMPGEFGCVSAGRYCMSDLLCHVARSTAGTAGAA